ncbi:hypothetical protein [Streptomyces sp. NPDC048641]|uniref:DNA polymerase Y family protein n=1 Tax=Streptomyces sp. NPDC048641 TaxID=3154825 RepID=UPI0034315AEC
MSSPASSSGSARSVLRARFDLTGHPAPESVYEQLLGLVEDLTPVYQPHPADFSVDLDISGALRLFGRSPHGIAAILQIRAIALYGVRATIGGGRSPMLAAVAAAATAYGHITVVAPDDQSVASFMRPRSVSALPGIGPAIAKSLARYGITTIGHLADTPPTTLSRLLGAHPARELGARAHGIDHRPVRRDSLVRSTGVQLQFAKDELEPDAHRATLLGLAEQLGSRLRSASEVCRALTIIVRYADRSQTIRSRRLAEASAHTADLITAAHSLYDGLALQRARVRQIALRAEQLAPAESAHHQLLFDPVDEQARRLEEITDAARSRFGDHVVTRGTLAAGRPRSR